MLSLSARGLCCSCNRDCVTGFPEFRIAYHPALQVTGEYTITSRLEATGEDIDTRPLTVLPAPIDAGRTRLVSPPTNSIFVAGQTSTARLQPYDVYGNAAGPGAAQQLILEVEYLSIGPREPGAANATAMQRIAMTQQGGAYGPWVADVLLEAAGTVSVRVVLEATAATSGPSLVLQATNVTVRR